MIDTSEYYGGCYPDPPENVEIIEDVDIWSYCDEIVDDIRLGLREE